MSKKTRKILITGGAGFIGSSLVRSVIARSETTKQSQSCEVVVVDKLTYAGDLARLVDAKGKFAFYKTDICHKKAMERIFKKEKPSIVLHLAAESHVDRSILGSDEFIETNVRGTQVILDAAKALGVERFVHISTDEVYGDIEKGQFYEHTAFNPSSPYSASKAAADLLVKSYIRTFKFPAIIVRPSNNYGPWQYPEKFIPVIIYKALNDQKIPVYGKGLNVREWLYVSDCADAIRLIMKKGRIGEAYNLGSGYETANIEIVKIILDILRKPHSLIEFVQDRPGHDLRYRLNSDKLRKELNWKTKHNFEKGIAKTIAWFVKNAGWVEKKSGVLSKYWKKVYTS